MTEKIEIIGAKPKKIEIVNQPKRVAAVAVPGILLGKRHFAAVRVWLG